jgi:DeoR/GlpR family transcriptional regulator of sugar metabolism
MVRAARRLIVVTDSSKWGVVGLSSMADLAEAATVISDTGLSAQASAVLSEQCGELVLVSPQENEQPSVDPTAG